MVEGAIPIPALAAIPDLLHGFGERTAFGRPETREQTRRRVARVLAPHGVLMLMKQVHGTRVVEAPWEGAPEADAALTEEPGVLLGIETADCLPLLLVDTRLRTVAVAHAGWRGTAAGVASRTVEALLARGSRAGDLVAALGPAIGPCCYEIGEELREAFAGDDAALVMRQGPGGRPHLDLRAANRLQLLRAGLAEAALFDLDECTRCRPDRYHSYRRDGRGAGRMISFVGFRPR